jgi:hypothetical protein
VSVRYFKVTPQESAGIICIFLQVRSSMSQYKYYTTGGGQICEARRGCHYFKCLRKIEPGEHYVHKLTRPGRRKWKFLWANFCKECGPVLERTPETIKRLEERDRELAEWARWYD